MPIEIGRNSIHMWQADFDLFLKEFGIFTDEKLNSFNTLYLFNSIQLRSIHQQWVVECEDLLKHKFVDTIDELSDVKMMALLVAVMSSYEFIDTYEGDIAGEASSITKERLHFLRAPELVLSFDFALNVIDWFETHNPAKPPDYTTSGFYLPIKVVNDIFQTISSHPADRKTIVCSIFSALYRRA
jgi:hypothetical protein